MRKGVTLFLLLLRLNGISQQSQDTVSYLQINNYIPNYQSCYIFRDSISLKPFNWQHIWLNALGLNEEALLSARFQWNVYTNEYKDSICNIKSKKNAVKEILKMAKKHKILILNEHHHQPQNRMFTSLFAKKLKRMGYDYFGAEGIEYLDSNQNKHHIPNVAGGHYLSESTYGNLIREYSKNDFKIFHYTSISDTIFSIRRDTLRNGSIMVSTKTSTLGNGYQMYDKFGNQTADGRFDYAKRDSIMAYNIYNLVKKNPNAKFVIHCGFGHLQKDEYFMGSILKNLLKEDFLTIDQAEFIQPPNGVEFQIYDSLVSNEPVLYQLKSGAFLSYYPKGVDMSVVMPKIKYIHGKPDWLLWNKNNRIKPIPFITKKINNYPSIVKLYLEREYKIAGDHATPIDVVFFENLDTKDNQWFCIPNNEKLRIVITPKDGIEENFVLTHIK